MPANAAILLRDNKNNDVKILPILFILL